MWCWKRLPLVNAVVLWPTQLLAISARSSSALEAASASIAAHLEEHPAIDLADACYTTQVDGAIRAPAHRDRSTREEAVKALSAGDRRSVFTRFDEAVNRPVTFMFTGQVASTSEWRANFTSFSRCSGGTRLMREGLKPEIASDLRESCFRRPRTQPCSTRRNSLNPRYSPSNTRWRGCGCPGASNRIAPSAIVLESMSRRVCGSLLLEDALRLIAARGRIMQKMPSAACSQCISPNTRCARSSTAVSPGGY